MQQDFEEFIKGYPVVIITRNGQPVLAHKSQGLYHFEVCGVAHRIRSADIQAVCRYIDATYSTVISLNVAEAVVQEQLCKNKAGICVVFIMPELALHMFEDDGEVVTTLCADDEQIAEASLQKDGNVIYSCVDKLASMHLLTSRLMSARTWLRGLMPHRPTSAFA